LAILGPKHDFCPALYVNYVEIIKGALLAITHLGGVSIPNTNLAPLPISTWYLK